MAAAAGASGSTKRPADETPNKDAALEEEKRMRDAERKMDANAQMEVTDLALYLRGWMVKNQSELAAVQQGQAAIASKLDTGLNGVNRELAEVKRKQAAAEAAQAVMKTDLENLQQQIERIKSGSGASTSAAATAAVAVGREALVDETTIFADVFAEEIVKAVETERSGKLIQLIERVASERGVAVRLGGVTAWQPRQGTQRGSAGAQNIRFNVSVPPGMRKELLIRVSKALREQGVMLRDRRTAAGQKLFNERKPIVDFIKQQGGKAVWRNGAEILGTKPGGSGEGLLTEEEIGKWAELRATAME